MTSVQPARVFRLGFHQGKLLARDFSFQNKVVMKYYFQLPKNTEGEYPPGSHEFVDQVFQSLKTD